MAKLTQAQKVARAYTFAADRIEEIESVLENATANYSPLKKYNAPMGAEQVLIQSTMLDYYNEFYKRIEKAIESDVLQIDLDQVVDSMNSVILRNIEINHDKSTDTTARWRCVMEDRAGILFFREIQNEANLWRVL